MKYHKVASIAAIMLSLSKRMLAIVLVVQVVIQNIDGNQMIVYVSDDHDSISDDVDFFTSGEDENDCFMYSNNNNCSYNSLDHALANLTSNVLINITTDVILSSLVKVSNVENISIIGHNNPIVNCKSAGGIHFTLCHNYIIQGIVWDGCGNHSEPGIKLSYFSNVTIQNCTFQHSKGQAIALSEALGVVHINDSRFVNNTHHRGHGAAIHYSSNNARDEFVFIVNNCNFTYNKMRSLVYLENRLVKYNQMIIINSFFSSNLGISVYAINHNIYLNGKVVFQNNIAKDGAGIYITDYSTVIFGENSDVVFVQNSANNMGGAVFLKHHSICLFGQIL